MNKNYILSSIGICILIVVSLFSCYLYYSLNMYDEFLPFIIALLLIVNIICIVCYFSKKSIIYNVGTFIMILCNVILLYNVVDIENRNEYVSNIFTNKYNYETYEVFVYTKTTKYNNIDKLENKYIGLLKDNDAYVINYLRKVIDINVVVYNSIEEIEIGIEQGDIQGFIIPRELYDNTDCGIKFKVRSIYHGKVKVSI